MCQRVATYFLRAANLENVFDERGEIDKTVKNSAPIDTGFYFVCKRDTHVSQSSMQPSVLTAIPLPRTLDYTTL